VAVVRKVRLLKDVMKDLCARVHFVVLDV